MMTRRIFLAIGFVFASLSGVAHAADADPTGTWKWTVTRNNNTREVTAKLKLDGEKLTGTITGRDNQESNIEEASFKDGEVIFSVTREMNGQKFTRKYKGKLEADTIKGKAEMTRDGNTESTDWEAKRQR